MNVSAQISDNLQICFLTFCSKEQNRLPVEVKNSQKNQFEQMQASVLEVGDIVLMKNEETFPADLVVLSTSNKGDCFIKTSSLDGEKNLKKRFQTKDFKNQVGNDDLQESMKEAFNLKGKLECGMPNKNLHKLDGCIYINDKEIYPIDENQLLLKGA